MPRILTPLIFWLTTVLLGATQVQAQELPDYASTYVNDFADILDERQTTDIENLLRQAKIDRDLEMTVVTINSRSDYGSSSSIETFAKNIFNRWGVGNPDRNDGILMLVAVKDREMRIALGAGYPSIYDGHAKRVIDSVMLPEFRNDRYAEGIVKGTKAALNRLRLPDRSAAWTSPDRWRGETQLITDRVRGNPIVSAILGLLGLGGAGIGGHAYNRRRPRKCPKCNGKMHRLGDVQEDQHLNYGQLVEERLASKDYGVWICPKDEHVTVIGYSKWFSKHNSCPNCSFKTYETDRMVLSHATTSRTGTARLDHHCEHCNHRASETVIVPMMVESSDSNGSGGGGFSGGGFSGGGSSGGGASGSW